MEHPSFSFEQAAISEYGEAFIIGVDEVGRGPLAGPVVAAAAHCRLESLIASGEIPDERFSLIRDSKTLTQSQREKSLEVIDKYFDTGTGIVEVATIDRINILQATLLAMKNAVYDLMSSIKNEADREAISGRRIAVFIDGNREIPGLEQGFIQRPIVRGDARSFSIAAASIVAKVKRDRLMAGLDDVYPGFGFSRHKGYGTAAHLDAIRRLGITPEHRRSFSPISEYVEK